MSGSTTVTVQVVDIRALARAVADGVAPPDVFHVDMVWLLDECVAHGAVPGTTCTTEDMCCG